MNKNKKIVFTALTLACYVVLSKFISIKTPLLVISFSFVPIMLIAYLLEPKYALLVGFLGDLIGALLFPTGAYFPGFTLSAALGGLINGLLLYNKKSYKGKNLFIRLLISSLLVSILIDGGLNTLWIYMITKKAFLVLLPTRLIKELLMVPIKTITMYLLLQNVNIEMIKND